MPSPQPPAVRACGLTRRYGALTALDQLNLELSGGQVTCLLGPNGAGKTSLVSLVLGRALPSSGELQVLGGTAGSLAVRRRLSAMLQSAALSAQLTVTEHLQLQRGYYRDARPLDWIMESAGLTALAQRRYAALSGGEQRRVQFALAICGRCDLLVLDEPTVALDADTRRSVWNVVRELAHEGCAVLLTTHDLDEAEALSDRVVLLAGGRIAADGTPGEVRARVGGRRIHCQSTLPLLQLRALPGVVAAEANGRHVELRTHQAEATLRALLGSDAGVTDIEVGGCSLEDAVIDLIRKEAA